MHKAQTLEELKALCARNANGRSGERSPNLSDHLQWNRETLTTITSSCGRYRISRRFVEAEGTEGYFLSTTSPPRHLSGPFLLARDARDAAQRHANGEPLQADLA